MRANSVLLPSEDRFPGGYMHLWQLSNKQLAEWLWIRICISIAIVLFVAAFLSWQMWLTGLGVVWLTLNLFVWAELCRQGSEAAIRRASRGRFIVLIIARWQHKGQYTEVQRALMEDEKLRQRLAVEMYITAVIFNFLSVTVFVDILRS
jgi:hypothetical protein